MNNQEEISILCDLEEILQSWNAILIQHRNMAKLIQEQTGKKDNLSNGYYWMLRSCINDIQELIKLHKDE